MFFFVYARVYALTKPVEQDLQGNGPKPDI